jgi:hypothetical protein
MLSLVKDLAVALLKSKKFTVALVTVIAYVAARVGWDVDQAELLAALSPMVAYVLAQAFADQGKEAAKLKGGE